MQRIVSSVLVSFVLGLVAESAKAQTSADITWWRNLSQSWRNTNILNRALADRGKCVDQSCKVWVQKTVVWEASHKVVWLPSNDPYCLWRWQPSSCVEVVAQNRWDTRFLSGQIMQAEVGKAGGGTIEHTMIIVQTSASTVTVIDSNYRGTNCVETRTYYWTDFRRWVRNFTLYQVR